MNDEAQDPDEAEIDPALLRWLPVTRREWLLPPVLVVALAVVVLLAARGHTSTVAAHRLDLGWRVAAVAGTAAALVMAPFGRRAYLDVSEDAARRYGRATGVAFLSVAVVLLVTGILTDNTFLASTTLFALWPFAPRLRSSVLRLAERDPARARRIATRVLLAAVVVVVLAVVLALAGPDTFATTYVVSIAFVYGPIVAIAAGLTRREIGRLRRSA
ncbi:hypothetical protein GCM10025867_29180 [Frondihabitans sucicola]|uniref:DUF3159 domain-containing protein n=1 Tax=Frondihabitans sucicola TaxID=1268041 RepID=A0ABN6Y004_9MICO|nr:hypothetical protein [Frondihabitans sucicola]BDZ50677.1 hypothetical protein GCM10025867_29180 [Frondihabitans sucicola]